MRCGEVTSPVRCSTHRCTRYRGDARRSSVRRAIVGRQRRVHSLIARCTGTLHAGTATVRASSCARTCDRLEGACGRRTRQTGAAVRSARAVMVMVHGGWVRPWGARHRWVPSRRCDEAARCDPKARTVQVRCSHSCVERVAEARAEARAEAQITTLPTTSPPTPLTHDNYHICVYTTPIVQRWDCMR